jgi:hypothetical protein
MIWMSLLMALVLSSAPIIPVSLADAAGAEEQAWKAYTNARFGFSVRYPENWRRGNPLPDGIGVTLFPETEHSLVALSGHMNLLEGSSQDRRQTLDEFTTAHRRIISELFDKKKIPLTWQKDQDTTLAGFPAKRLAFTYQDERRTPMLEIHIFSLGRNEGRGMRIKMPVTAQKELQPTIAKMLESYQPGRDQNAVSPLIQKPEQSQTAPK